MLLSIKRGEDMIRIIITRSPEMGWDMITSLEYLEDKYTEAEKREIEAKYAEIDSTMLDPFQFADAKNYLSEKLGVPAAEIDVHTHIANACIDCY